MTALLISLGFSRDDMIWLWGRLASGSLLIVSGLVPLDNYVGPTWHKVITVSAVVVLWLSGKYDSSELPAKKVV